MTEAEILNSAMEGAQGLLAVFSVFLSMVSAYIVALYWFLSTSPFGLRMIGFLLLTVALVTLGALAYNLQHLGEGIHVAWQALPTKSTGMESLGPPLIVQSIFLDGRDIASSAAWVFGAVVYLALAYMTFIYRWPKAPNS
jgi:hypothetical protein